MERIVVADELAIEASRLKEAAVVFRAVNNNLRWKILELLHENEQVNVTGIYIKLRIEQSVASAHLKILRNARLVTTYRQRRAVYYRVDYQRLEELSATAQQLLTFEDTLSNKKQKKRL